MIKPPNVHLITFGGGSFAFRRSARRLASQAMTSGVFSSITYLYDKQLKDFYPDFWSAHSKFILALEKGYGYWLWKPAIIKRKLAEIPEGDILFYLDSGCEFNLGQKGPRSRFMEYLEATNLHGSLAMQTQDFPDGRIFPKEENYSKRLCIDELKPSASTLDSNQIWGGFIMLKNNPVNRNLVSKWFDYCKLKNYSLLTDTSDNFELAEFQAHRHDQSIFSILYKESSHFYIPDETDWRKNWSTHGANYPVWSLRNRSGISNGPMYVPDKIDRLYSRFMQVKNIVSKSKFPR